MQNYVNDYNTSNQIVEENWVWFKGTLKVLALNNVRFQFKCKEINSKLYVVKYFSKIKFAIAENSEEELKFELKNYFKEISYDNVDDFINAFFNLPFEFVSLVVRYVTNVLVPEVKPKLTTNYNDANSYLKGILKKKNDFIVNINKVSLGQSTNFSVSEAGLLLNLKVFYDYNALNNGALEYIMKTFSSNAQQKLIDQFGGKIQYMKEQILAHPSYLQFLKEIKENKEEPFFTKDGFQNSDRKITFDDYVKKYFSPEEFIPKKNNSLENNTKEPQNNDPLQSSQPSEEELLQ